MNEQKPVKMVLRSVHLPKVVDDILTKMSRDTRISRDVIIKFAVIDWLGIPVVSNKTEEEEIVEEGPEWSDQDNAISGF